MKKLWSLSLLALLHVAPLWADAPAGAPPAQRILVITGSDSMIDFTRFMQQNGNQWGFCAGTMNGTGWISEMQLHTVTVNAFTVPSAATMIANYDQVWDMRFAAASCQTTIAACGANGVTAAQQTDYLNYIAAGGSVFLMGDNGGYPGRNDGILAIARAVDSANTFQLTGVLTNNDATHQGAYINAGSAVAAENFNTDYRNMTGANNWVATQYNGLIQTWGNGYAVLRDNLTGDATAVAFDCGNMKPAYTAGKLVVAFDWQMMGGGGQVGYCPPNALTGVTFGSNQSFWENSLDFLVEGNVCQTPTNTPATSPTRTVTRTATRTASPTPTHTPTSTSTITVVTPTFTVTRSSTLTATPTPSRTITFTSTSTITVVTATFTVTATSTRTVSPSSTFTPSRTATPSITETNTPGPTATYTVTRSNTRTVTPSSTETSTSTSTATRSATATITPTSTDTPISTATSTRTITATSSATRTATPTYTASPTSTETSLASATHTPSITVTSTFTATRTATLTSSATATETATRTASPTQTVTATGTSTATVSYTRTNSPTATVTATSTSTVTVSDTRTASPTYTHSPTHSPTEVPAPFQILVRVYNSAGELVRVLYNGASEIQPRGISLDKSGFVSGLDSVGLDMGGRLQSGATAIYWQGDNDNGQGVGAGTYYIKVESSDTFGTVTSYTQPVTVIPAPSTTWLKVLNSAGELVWQSAITVSASSFTLSGDTVAVAGEGQAPASAYALGIKVTDGRGSEWDLGWDGMTLQGHPAASGSYSVLLVSSRQGSSAVVQSVKVQVLRGIDNDLLGNAFLAPNPSTRAKEVQLHYTVQAGLPLRAELYNLAGERILANGDEAQSGIVKLDVNGLSSGVYACVVTQGKMRRVLKLAIVK